MRSVSGHRLTQKRTLSGGSALQLLDLRLLEDGGERGGALGSDAVVRDAASNGRDGNGDRVGMPMGNDVKANARARQRTSATSRSSPGALRTTW